VFSLCIYAMLTSLPAGRYFDTQQTVSTLLNL